MLLSPISGEAAGAGSGKDGVTEALENGRDLLQPSLAGVDLTQEHIQLVNNSILFT